MEAAGSSSDADLGSVINSPLTTWQLGNSLPSLNLILHSFEWLIMHVLEGWLAIMYFSQRTGTW